MYASTRRRWTWALLALLMVPQLALGAGKVLRLRFDGPVPEKPREDAELMTIFSGQQSRTLLDWVRLIQQAAEDPDVKALAMIIEQPQLGLAQLEEITAALGEFRKTGKKVHAYLDTGGNGTYALACAADTITIAEHSDLNVIGIYAELSYYKNLLDKLGVVAQFTHCGAYKSALEPFTRTGPSPEAAENVNWLLDELYEDWIGLIAKGRGMSVERVEALVDEGPWSAEKALEAGLVDYVGSFADFKRMIRKEYGKDVEVVKKLGGDEGVEIDFENPFAIFQLLGEMMQEQQEPHKDGIALIYVDGSIALGKSDQGPFGGGGNAGSTTIRAAFEKAYNDDAIKAIVVRVDSPGGSAVASDIMWKAAVRCAAEKPVIVSMGNVAGSGGYYISAAGDVIFADRATITASIGVVGGKFVWKDLMENKLGITHAAFARGKHADLWSMNRLWNDEEMRFIQGYMNEVYEQFKSRVKQSRGDRLKKDIEELAGGRVFTGSQALELGLIDRIGGLSDAIGYAVKKADLGEDYELYILPEPKNPLDAIVAALTGEEQEDEWEMFAGRGAVAAADPLLRAVLPLVQRLGPEQAATLMSVMDRIELINREHFGCLMPFDLTIR